MTLPSIGLACLLACQPLLCADPRVGYLRDHAIGVRTIDEPSAPTADEPVREDFSDLIPLKALIGSARVVALGEQSHGDGATFKAKCRLVRFLHQEMGFEVLAWESGLFDCRRVDELFAQGVEPGSAAKVAHEHGIFGIWAQSAQAAPVLEYAARSARADPVRRLMIAGFDSQYTSAASRRAHADWLSRWFASLTTPNLPAQMIDEGVEAVRWMAARLREDGKPPGGSEERLDEAREQVRALVAILESRRADLARSAEPREIEFVRRTLVNLLAFDRAMRGMNRANIQATPAPILQERDERMGSNLAFLARTYYPDKKIIAWAASSHLLRNPEECQSLYGRPRAEGPDAFKPMGHFAAADLGADYFSITFSAFEGSIGRPWSGPTPVPAAEPGDIESLMKDAGLSLAIISLRPTPGDPAAAWLGQPQVMRPMGYGRERAVWGRCFDALFFTREMTPSTSTAADQP